MDVYTPEWWLPKLYRPRYLAERLDAERLRRARARLARMGARRVVLYLWRPEFAHALDLVDHDVSCYHVDDEYTFSTVDLPTPPGEEALLRRVDQVFVHSPGLFDKKGGINPRTMLAPNGVDFRAFSTPVPEPRALAAIPRPRIGYIGYIKPQLDFGLMLELARRHPNWSFVFVGPRGALRPADAELVGQLSALRNVWFTGCQPVSELPAFAQWMNAAVMPYRQNGYTKYIFPLKLHEYLASGRPVVAAPVRSLLDFGHVVALARSVDEWSEALSRAVSEAGESSRDAAMRREVAREYDWDILVDRIAGAIANRLESRG